MFFRIKEFHKRHHTWLLLAETIIIAVGILVLSCLARIDVLEYDKQILKGYSLSFENMKLPHYFPVAFAFLEVLLIMIVIALKNMKNPIFAKKCVHVLFFVSLVILAIDIIVAIFFSNVVVVYDDGQAVTYNHTLSSFIIAALQALISFDINIWRSEFGLEKYYG